MNVSLRKRLYSLTYNDKTWDPAFNSNWTNPLTAFHTHTTYRQMMENEGKWNRYEADVKKRMHNRHMWCLREEDKLCKILFGDGIAYIILRSRKLCQIPFFVYAVQVPFYYTLHGGMTFIQQKTVFIIFTFRIFIIYTSFCIVIKKNT